MAAFINQEPLPKPRGRKRRWQIPPLPHPFVGGFPGFPILEEVTYPAVGLLLWQRFSDVLEWVRAPASDRASLFDSHPDYLAFLDGAAHSTEIPRVLLAIGEALRTGSSRSAREMAHLCQAVGDWASREGFVQTAAMYYLLAAHAAPTNPVLNFAAARAERICARYHRAEQWFQRAIGLARRAGDDDTYASAYLGWGLLEEQRGDHAAARVRYTRALRAARRGKLLPLAAAAHHNMIPLAAQSNDFAKGQNHIVSAYNLYGETATAIRLAADAAAFWASFGYFALAKPVYSAVRERISEFSDQVQVLANIGRAAAAVGNVDEYASIYDELTALASSGRHFPARAWVDLAEGARTLGQTRNALDLAGRALEAAEPRGEQATLAAARRVLAAVQSAAAVDRNQSAPEPLRQFAAKLIRRVSSFPPCSGL